MIFLIEFIRTDAHWKTLWENPDYEYINFKKIKRIERKEKKEKTVPSLLMAFEERFQEENPGA